MRFGISSSGRTWVSFGPLGFIVITAIRLAGLVLWAVVMLFALTGKGIWWLANGAGAMAVTAARRRGGSRRQLHAP